MKEKEILIKNMENIIAISKNLLMAAFTIIKLLVTKNADDIDIKLNVIFIKEQSISLSKFLEMMGVN